MAYETTRIAKQDDIYSLTEANYVSKSEQLPIVGLNEEFHACKVNKFSCWQLIFRFFVELATCRVDFIL